jgi:hypothetical protein
LGKNETDEGRLLLDDAEWLKKFNQPSIVPDLGKWNEDNFHSESQSLTLG